MYRFRHRHGTGFNAMAAALCALLPLAVPALAGQEPAMTESSAAAAETLASTAAAVPVRGVAVTIELVSTAAAAGLHERLAALPTGREVYLVLDGLRVVADPGTLYQVELVTTEARRAPLEKARAVGSFNVFGVAHAQGATSRRSFVVTAALRELLARGGVAARVVPDAQAAADANVEIGRISLLLQ
jgi:hypothetical protein